MCWTEGTTSIRPQRRRLLSSATCFSEAKGQSRRNQNSHGYLQCVTEAAISWCLKPQNSVFVALWNTPRSCHPNILGFPAKERRIRPIIVYSASSGSAMCTSKGRGTDSALVWGDGGAPTVQSALDTQSSLARSADQYVGQGEQTILPSSRIINAPSPMAAFPSHASKRGARSFCAGDALWAEPGAWASPA